MQKVELWTTVPSLLLFQQGWNITVDLVIGPKGIRQMTSQDAKVERDWGQAPPSPRLSRLLSLLPPTLAAPLVLPDPLLKAESPWYEQLERVFGSGLGGARRGKDTISALLAQIKDLLFQWQGGAIIPLGVGQVLALLPTWHMTLGKSWLSRLIFSSTT